MSSNRPLFPLPLLGLLLIALGLRCMYLLELPTFPWFFRPEVDAYYYDQGARAIAGGDTLLQGQMLNMSPGYYYLLGLVYSLCGFNPWSPRLLQLAFGLGLVMCVWDSARRVLGDKFAWLPCLLAAAYGPAIYFEAHLLSDAPGAFASMLLLTLTLRVVQHAPGTLRAWCGVGVCWGVCCVLRPNALLFAAPLGYALWFAHAQIKRGVRRRQLAAKLALLLTAAALVIAPLTLRNLAATGEPVLLVAHGGLNLYVGNGPGATGTWRSPPEIRMSSSPQQQYTAFHAAAERAAGHSLSARDADAYWTRRTLALMLQDPEHTLRILARKFHLFWSGRELHNIYDYEFTRMISVVLGLPLVQFLWISPFALAGLCLALLRPGLQRVAAGFALTAMLSVVIVFVTDRYRLPTVGPLLLMAAIACERLWRALVERDRKTLAALGAVLAVGVVLAVPVHTHKQMHAKYQHLAHAWLVLGGVEYAQWALERALQADPQFLPALEDAVDLQLQRGDLALARAALERFDARARALHDAQASERSAAFAKQIDDRLARSAQARP